MRVSDLPENYHSLKPTELTAYLVTHTSTLAGVYFGLDTDYRLFNQNAYDMHMDCLDDESLQVAECTLRFFLLYYLFKQSIPGDTLFSTICSGSPFSLSFTIHDFLNLDKQRLSELPIKWKLQAYLDPKTTVPFDYEDKALTWQYSQLELQRFCYWALPDSYDLFSTKMIGPEFFQSRYTIKICDNIIFFYVLRPQSFDWSQFKDIQPGTKHILRIVCRTRHDALWYGLLAYCAQHCNKSQYSHIHTYHVLLYTCGYQGWEQDSIDMATGIANEKLAASKLYQFTYGKDNLRELKRLKSETLSHAPQ